MFTTQKVTFLILNIIVAAAPQQTEVCNDSDAKCIVVTECEFAASLLLNGDTNHIRKIACGFSLKLPKVCCPMVTTKDIIQFNNDTDVDRHGSVPLAYSTTTATYPNVPNDVPRTTPLIEKLERAPPIPNPNKNVPKAPRPNPESNGKNILNIGFSNSNNVLPELNNQRLPASQVSIFGEASHAARFPEIAPENDLHNLLPNKSICGTQELEDKIIGGDLTALEEYPWTVRLQYQSRTTGLFTFRCAGSLISKRYVLTAAHCVVDSRTYELKRVRLGEWNSETEIDCDHGKCAEPYIDVAIEEIITHPDFNIEEKQYIAHSDIALIRLANPVDFSDFVRPICLPIKENDILNSANGYWAAGWGTTEFGIESAVKRKVRLDAVDVDVCKVSYPSRISEQLSKTMICAGGRKNEDSCRGDSGGPLMQSSTENYMTNWYLRGIISFGPRRCGEEGRPSIYTRIGAFMEWILRNLRR